MIVGYFVLIYFTVKDGKGTDFKNSNNLKSNEFEIEIEFLLEIKKKS